MSKQPMNLRRAFELIWRNKALVGIAVGLGLIVGAAMGSINPPPLTSSALVVLPSTRITTQTLLVIAVSDPVFSAARPNINPPPVGIVTLGNQVTATSPSADIISINAQNTSAAIAESTANAVATSFVGYLASSQSPIGQLDARILQSATTASGPNPLVHRLVYGLVGAIAGLLVGMIAAIARGRRDRRLRTRDDIANSIGIPVLASLPVAHPASPDDWAKLLDGYEPAPVHAWRLRKALQQLHVAESNQAAGSEPVALAVVSLTNDVRALALGPQLAVFAASLGIPTALAIGPSQDPQATAALRAACTAWQGGRRTLRVAVLDGDGPGVPRGAALTVFVAVVDGDDPQPISARQAAATLLGVSPGGTTAEHLARAAMSAAAESREVVGLLVADPDPSDRTTGRLPQLPRPALRMPTRVSGMTMEAQR